MKGFKRKIALAVAIAAGFLIGSYRSDAQKSKLDETKDDDHKQIADKEVVLDDYEIAAFHNS